MELQLAVKDYLDIISVSKKPKTYEAYETALRYFQESCKKVQLTELERIDLVRYISHLKNKGLSQRTIFNKFNSLAIFLKTYNMENLIHKSDWPRFTQEEPEVYSKDQLDQFFAHCSPYETVLFKFFLMTGFRESEVMHCNIKDINLMDNTVGVSYKIDFTPKTYKERKIPLHPELKKLLVDYIKESNITGTLFPSDIGTSRTDMLEICKSVAKRAGLNPIDFWLHRFRSTFATSCLRAGIDVKTVQQFLGHNNLSSTMRYLVAARGTEAQSLMNGVNF